MRWEPILDNQLAEQATEAARAITLRLVELPENALAVFASEDEQPAVAASLAGGNAGLSIALFELAELFDHAPHTKAAVLNRAELALDAAVEAVADVVMEPALTTGFVGIAWALERLRGKEADLNAEIDQALAEMLATSWRRPYHVARGLAGIGVYALERVRNGRGASLLEGVVAQLDALAEHGDDGARIKTLAQHNPASARGLYLQGVYNLGVPYGMGGVVGLLGRIVALGTGGPAGTRSLLEAMIRWLLQQDCLFGGPERGVPAYVAPEGPVFGGYQAWSYGDPGFAAMLLGAARGARNGEWEARAVAFAERAARLPVEMLGMRDAGLAGGAAGIAHTFNRCYQATLSDRLRDSARRWFAETLRYRDQDPTRGIAGFSMPRYEDRTKATWRDSPEPGLLHGAAGTALALAAAASDRCPKWDRWMLLDWEDL